MSDYQQITINHQKYNYELDPDLIFNFNSKVVEYVYTDSDRIRETNDTITLQDLNAHGSPEVHEIKSVLCCKANQDPYLLIICSDNAHNNYIFSHNVKTKSIGFIKFNKPIKGKVTHADMTCSPFRVAYVDRLGTIDTKSSFAMVIGTMKDDATLILLTLDPSEGVINVELTETFKTNPIDKQYIGHVTAICILTADKGDKRMGHSDPQILLGFSKGAILIYRIRASVYSYKASRIRVPVDLSEFTEFPGYPITQLSCARSYNSLLMNVALAQEKPNDIKYQYRQSYIKVVETRGDSTRRQRAIINPPESIQSSAKILETKLIPSTTTLADSTLQLSIIFQNGKKSYDLNIWEVSPTKINQALFLAMDQQSCVDTMAKSDTVKSLKLDSNGYLTHVPQKIADIILEENEDEDANHTLINTSSNHSVVADDNSVVEESIIDEKPAVSESIIEDNPVVAESIKEDNPMLAEVITNDDPMLAEAITDDDPIIAESITTGNLIVAESIADEREVVSLENSVQDVVDVKQEQEQDVKSEDLQDVANILSSMANEFIATDSTELQDINLKRQGDELPDVEPLEKRQKTSDADKEASPTTFDDSATFVMSDDSDSFDKDQFKETIIEEKQHYKSKVTEIKLHDDQKIAQLEDDYVMIDHKDVENESTELPIDGFDGNAQMSNDSIEDNSATMIDDSMSGIVTEERRQEQQAIDTIHDSPFIADSTESVEHVLLDQDARVVGDAQMIVKEDTDMVPSEDSDQASMQNDDNGLDEASFMADDMYGPDYTDQADDYDDMFNKAAHDFPAKEDDTTMIISSSEDEMEESHDDAESTTFKQNDENIDEEINDQEASDDNEEDLREGSYLEESDEIQFSDMIEKDPIEDKDLLTEEDNIKFVSGGELSDANDLSSSNTPQQIFPQQQPTIDYIPVSTEDLLRLLNNQQNTVNNDPMDVDNYATPPQFITETLPQPEPEPEPEPEPVVDENLLAYTDMQNHCFGSTEIDLESISQAEIETMGNYCWNSTNIQLKMFMLKYCQLHHMHNEGFLMAKWLLRKDKKAMSNQEIEECIALKKSLKVDRSVKFGEILNPFNDAARHQLKQQEREFYMPKIPVDFYKSGQGQIYLDYYNTGRI